MAKPTQKVTVRSVITNGISNGWTMDKILKTVKKKCPSSVADESHVKFYSAQLKRDGVITPEQHAKYITRKAAAKEKPAKEKPAKEKPAKEKKERKVRSKKSKKD